MFIEQFVEFELTGPGPLVIHVILKPVIFMTKQRSLIFCVLLAKGYQRGGQEKSHQNGDYLK